MSDQPLKGLRVLEFCWIWSGPYLGQFLADLGAEVIKIEWYQRFDPYRTRGVERLRGQVPWHIWRESSPSFHSLNRNKVGLSVDLKSARGRELVYELVEQSDVVIDNFTSGTMAGLGLGFDDLRQRNDKIVTVSLSGFSTGSDLEEMRAYGLVLSALSGIEAEIYDDTGEFLGSPSFVISDPNAALYGLLAVVSGLLRRTANKEGLSVEVSQLEAAASLAWGLDIADEAESRTTEGRGQSGVSAFDGGFFAWSSPVDCSLPADMAARPLSAAEDALRPAGGVVVSIHDWEQATRVADSGVCPATVDAIHPITGPERLVGSPWQVNGSRSPLRKPAPVLGEGALYILTQVLDYSYEQAERLISSDFLAERSRKG